MLINSVLDLTFSLISGGWNWKRTERRLWEIGYRLELNRHLLLSCYPSDICTECRDHRHPFAYHSAASVWDLTFSHSIESGRVFASVAFTKVWIASKKCFFSFLLHHVSLIWSNDLQEESIAGRFPSALPLTETRHLQLDVSWSQNVVHFSR